MGKSSIHMQTATAGTILHNSRENYSKSVVFPDEKNELWNDSKTAFKLFREELEIRSNAYTARTKQKLQKNASTMISAVVNLEQHHTLKDLEDLKNYIEKEFDTKIIQMAIHRDEGKLINKNNPVDKLVSGKDFFLNAKDNELYFDNKFTQKINMDEWEIEKNYHGHFEMLGIDSDGNSLRKKMNIYKLSKLQDFTAESLNMERTPSNVEVVKENGVEKVKRKTTKNKKRLDTHEYKEQAKIINEFNMASDNEKQKIIKKTNEIINNEKEDKKKLKEELEELKKANSIFREELKANQSEREHYKLQEQLNKQLQEDLKANKIELSEALEQIEELKKDIFHPVHKTESGITLTNKEVADYFENITIPDLQKENESLKEQNSILESKVITLEEKINSRANMNDYELLKKENEALKKENSFLKRVVDKVLIYANSKIKELINFGKPQFKQSVSLEDFKEVIKEDNHKKEDLDYYDIQNNLLQR